jgi:hypothetical protein
MARGLAKGAGPGRKNEGAAHQVGIGGLFAKLLARVIKTPEALRS